MGRKSLHKSRKKLTGKVNNWLADLFITLQNEDLQNLTIDDIAKLAGKSKSTIYEYFESKEEILLAACQTRILFLTTNILEGMPEDDDPTISYHYLMEEFAKGIGDVSIAFLQNIKLYYPTSWAAVDEFTDHFSQLLKSLYQKGIEGGYFNSISIDLMVHFDKYFVTAVITDQSLFSEEGYSLSDIVQDYLKLRLRGLSKK